MVGWSNAMAAAGEKSLWGDVNTAVDSVVLWIA